VSEPGEDREIESVAVGGVEHRKCKACGCPLTIVMGPNGKRIPLDMRATCYVLSEDLHGAPVAAPSPARVTHFATCTKSSSFSQKGSKR
jgi:hypothetical protein